MTARIVRDGPQGRRAALAALRAGELIAFPTDTVYGIGVAPAADRGLERLFEAKHRPPDRNIVLLLADVAQVGAHATLTPAGEALAAAFWPGGLTIVLPSREGPAATVGLRVPNHPAPRALARALGALPTTSANLSGEPEARDAAEILARLGTSLGLILDGGSAPGGPASTVVDATTTAVTILRHGAVSDEAIAEVLRAAGLPEPVGR